MQGLQQEWALQKPLIENKKILSIYFGGGTPSLLGAKYIEQILSWIRTSCTFDSSLEITLEANPEHLTKELLSSYRDIGINRLSIGVQTLDDALLKKIGRTHNAKEAVDGIYSAHDIGMDNISIDLMYDLPDQTLSSWQETVNTAASLPITHLSLYNLTIEPHTLFFKKKQIIERAQPSEEASVQMYKYAISTLEASNLLQYEISAFAKEGFESKHNVGYWTARPFLGFGPSAFSYWENRRFRNVCNLNKYVKSFEEGLSCVDFEEKLDLKAHQNELLALQLRLIKGVDIDLFEKEHGSLSSETKKSIDNLLKEDLLKFMNSKLSLTKRGILFYDTVAVELI